MIQYKFNMFNSNIHVFQFDPKSNPSQVVYRNPRTNMTNFKHNWFETRGFKEVAKFNLGFFNMSDINSSNYGMAFTDFGIHNGYPSNNAFEMWLDRSGILNIEHIKNRNDITSSAAWAITLGNSLVIDGKEDLGNTTGFNTLSKTNRTAFGQRYDGQIVCVYAESATAEELASIMVELNCNNAILADGGGSSCYQIGGQIQRNTGRPLGTMLLVFDKDTQTVPLKSAEDYKKFKYDNITDKLYTVEIINTPTLNIRNIPTITNSDILGVYALGDIVDIYGENNGWLRTNIGWISSSFTKIIPEFTQEELQEKVGLISLNELCKKYNIDDKIKTYLEENMHDTMENWMLLYLLSSIKKV